MKQVLIKSGTTASFVDINLSVQGNSDIGPGINWLSFLLPFDPPGNLQYSFRLSNNVANLGVILTSYTIAGSTVIAGLFSTVNYPLSLKEGTITLIGHAYEPVQFVASKHASGGIMTFEPEATRAITLGLMDVIDKISKSAETSAESTKKSKKSRGRKPKTTGN